MAMTDEHSRQGACTSGHTSKHGRGPRRGSRSAEAGAAEP